MFIIPHDKKLCYNQSMKKFVLKSLFTIFFIFAAVGKTFAVDFNVLVLPTNIYSVCDNYFCFPETSEIIAEDVIVNLNSYKSIHAAELAEVRMRLLQLPQLKTATEQMLKQYEQNEKIDFQTLQQLSKEFNVKSIILIANYAINDKSSLKRNVWEALEISTAFKITYPFTMRTTAVLTDTVNNIVMWSNKYNKQLTNSNGFFSASNQAQAASQLEKIKQYSKNNVAQNISQNINMRFFPKDVRTFNIKNKQSDVTPQFTPNALENLITPQMTKELQDGQANTINTSDDFIFEF